MAQGLIGLVQDPNSEVQAAAGIALSTLGKDAEPALPHLRAMQNAKDTRVAAIGKAAVEKISQAASNASGQ